MKIILNTERLTLREFHLDDAQFIIRLVNSPDWIKFIGDRNIKTVEQAEEYLTAGPLKSYAVYGFGLNVVELTESNIPIGMCGIIKRDSLERPDIGFAFLPEYFGKGYGFEIASATLGYAVQVLRIPSICAITVANNTASIRLIEKLGLTIEKTFQYPDTGEELQLYKN